MLSEVVHNTNCTYVLSKGTNKKIKLVCPNETNILSACLLPCCVTANYKQCNQDINNPFARAIDHSVRAPRRAYWPFHSAVRSHNRLFVRPHTVASSCNTGTTRLIVLAVSSSSSSSISRTHNIFLCIMTYRYTRYSYVVCTG